MPTFTLSQEDATALHAFLTDLLEKTKSGRQSNDNDTARVSNREHFEMLDRLNTALEKADAFRGFDPVYTIEQLEGTTDMICTVMPSQETDRFVFLRRLEKAGAIEIGPGGNTKIVRLTTLGAKVLDFLRNWRALGPT